MRSIALINPYSLTNETNEGLISPRTIRLGATKGCSVNVVYIYVSHTLYYILLFTPSSSGNDDSAFDSWVARCVLQSRSYSFRASLFPFFLCMILAKGCPCLPPLPRCPTCVRACYILLKDLEGAWRTKYRLFSHQVSIIASRCMSLYATT